MKKIEQLLTIDETIMVLRARLGEPVVWAAWLADIRRSRNEHGPDLYGLQLPPACLRPGRRNRQPLYSASAIKAFVAAAKLENPKLGPTPFQTYEYEFTTDELQSKVWKHIHAVPATPTAPAAA